jgi:hypothetical protein
MYPTNLHFFVDVYLIYMGLILLSFILGLALVGLVVFFVLEGQPAVPVLAGQRWRVKGLGTVTIIQVLGPGKNFERYGKGINVAYRTRNEEVGYCSKFDIMRVGNLIEKMDTSKPEIIDPKNSQKSFEPLIYDRNGTVTYIDTKWWAAEEPGEMIATADRLPSNRDGC